MRALFAFACRNFQSCPKVCYANLTAHRHRLCCRRRRRRRCLLPAAAEPVLHSKNRSEAEPGLKVMRVAEAFAR